MQDSYGEGVANHTGTGPELCVHREVGGEALGRSVSKGTCRPEITKIRVSRSSVGTEGNILSIGAARWAGTPTWSETPRMHGSTSHANREIPGFSVDY